MTDSPTAKPGSYYNVGEDMERYREHSMQPSVEKLCDKHLGESGSALDVGCASGRTSAFLRRQGWHVTGIELDPVGAAQAREMLDVVHEGNAEDDPPFPSGHAFDLILMTDVLEHMVDPWSALARYTGLLRKGGALLVVLPNACHISVIGHLLDGRFPYKETGLMDSGHLRWFTPLTANEMIENAGMHVADASYIGNEDSAMADGVARLRNGVTIDMSALPHDLRARHSVRKMHLWCEVDA